MTSQPKNILVAPLNWGLGHASRCIPLITELNRRKMNVIIASDGAALQLLKKEFPENLFLELPSYKIKYSQHKWFFLPKLLMQFSDLYKAIRNEHQLVNEWIDKYKIDTIISDNRLGCYSTNTNSIYISHQLQILPRFFDIPTKIHHYFINKFNYCWIPDCENPYDLSGELSEMNVKIKQTRMGVQSRFNKVSKDKKWDVAVVLSGPEPQRTQLENIILKKVPSDLKIVLVRGLMDNEKTLNHPKNITSYNYLLMEELENILNESALMISRSGYSSIMDAASLKMKAIFIPTPGQTEQEYLARYMNNKKIAPFVNQNNFSWDLLNMLEDYRGFTTDYPKTDWDILIGQL